MEAQPPAHVTEFVVQLLNAGHTVVNLVENLAEALAAATAESIENTRHDVLAMVMGTVSVRLTSSSRDDFVRATELVEGTVAAILGDLHRAAELAGRREATVRSAHGF